LLHAPAWIEHGCDAISAICEDTLSALLTLIIPTYKRNDDLAACLASVRSNSATQVDVLVYHPFVDEALEQICAVYGAESILDGSRINGQRVKGLWQVINEGIATAETPFVCWLNDDCLVNPGWDQVALDYFSDDVGLVVFKTSGIAEVSEYRVAETRFGVPSANYGVLRKAIPCRFDVRYHWYQADEDLPLTILKETHFRVVGTTEGLIVHNHRMDENRAKNDADPRVHRDRTLFQRKWRYFQLKGGRVVRIGLFRSLPIALKQAIQIKPLLDYLSR
jgi:hypothetical protein